MQPVPLYLENEQRPFESHKYILVKGTDRQKIELDVRDTDMVLVVDVYRRTVHILHLHHVRAETSAAAQTAIEDFLDQLKLLHDQKSIKSRREFVISGCAFDECHDNLNDFVTMQAKERGLHFDWADHSWPRELYRGSWKQPGYIVSFSKDGTSKVKSWNRPVLPETERALPDADGRIHNRAPAWTTSNDG